MNKNFYIIAMILTGVLFLFQYDTKGEISGTSIGKKPLMKDFMGINFHTFQVDAAKYSTVAGLARDYHPYAWDTQGDTSAIPPFPMSREKILNGKEINWKDLYSEWKKAGFKIDVSLTVGWTKQKNKFKDIPKDVEMYGEKFARFFGPSGENKLVESFEIGNEPVPWTNAEYTELFKYMSKGLRKGDPKLKIVTCTASALTPDRYEKPMSCFKGLEDYFDVISLHSYSMIKGWPTWERVYPEHPEIRYLKTIDAMVEFRNKDPKLHNKEIWITEFGYDACSEEALKRPRKKPFKKWISSTELQQAQWLIRSFLIFASKDLNRAYMYWFDDKDNPSFHASSGITRNGKPKKAFYAMQYLYQKLGDYRFSKVITEKPDNLYVYEFIKNDPKKIVWVAWSPTQDKVGNMQVLTNLPGVPVKVEEMPVITGKAPGVNLTKVDNGIKVKVTESPIFIFIQK